MLKEKVKKDRGKEVNKKEEKNGEMPRCEESWLFVKESDRKGLDGVKLRDGCWQVPDVGFTI